MAYIRFKEVSKYFYFSKAIDKHDLPKYVTDYLFPYEKILAAYKVGKDHGMITDEKIVLFDNSLSFRPRKIILTIPYHSLSSHSITFYASSAEINILLDSGYPLRLIFVNLSEKDKIRLRLLYRCISEKICNKEIPKEELKALIEDNF